MSGKIKQIRASIHELGKDWYRQSKEELDRRRAAKAVLQQELKNELLKSLISALRHSSIQIMYSGGGDDGGIEEITGARDSSERDLIEEFFYSVCYPKIRGFENNEGGGGTVKILLCDGAVKVQHDHYLNIENWEQVETKVIPASDAVVAICKERFLIEVSAEFAHKDLYITVADREAEGLLYPHLDKICEQLESDYGDEYIRFDLKVDPIIGEVVIEISEQCQDQEYEEIGY